MKTVTVSQLAQVTEVELETLAQLFADAAAHLEDRLGVTVLPDHLANQIEAKAEKYRASHNTYLAAICIKQGLESDAVLHLDEAARCRSYAEMLLQRNAH